MQTDLQAQLDELPKQPGVYLFSDKRNKLLYVGKARNLRNRVRSYFQNTPKGPRIQTMVRQIAHLRIVATETEGEALLLENSFIKNNKPYYNVMLRDDKTYPYIKITNELFPRVLFTRRKAGKDGRYFGPFPSARAARQTIRLLHQHFKIRNCDLELGEKSYRPCLQFHIKRCEAPCDFKVTAEQYAEGVERAALFLDGKREDLIKELSGAMMAASESLAFEKAAYFRDLLGMVNAVQRPQNVASLKYDKMDVVGYATDGWQATVQVIAIRGGSIVRSASFHVEWEEGPETDLAKWLSHYYLNHEDPPSQLIVARSEGLELLAETFRETRERVFEILTPQRGSKKRLLEMAEENAQLNLELNRQEETLHPGLVQLADVLDLSAVPAHMECFDISNIQGTNSVASMVCFINGKPSKKNYRKFTIKTVEGPDDFASMSEVVHRRYKRLLDEARPLPDLIVIDGGLGQLHAAHDALIELGLGDHPLISLAKREELVYRPFDSEPIAIPHHEPALRLLQHIRDETHRFGVTFHRQKRGKHMLSSELDGIPGLGPVRRQKLLHHFGSVKRIREAGLAQLAGVVGKQIARVVFESLRS